PPLQIGRFQASARGLKGLRLDVEAVDAAFGSHRFREKKGVEAVSPGGVRRRVPRLERLPDQLFGQGEYGREHHGENAALRVWRSIASLLPQGSWLLPGGYPSQRGAIPWGIFFALPGVAPFQFV